MESEIGYETIKEQLDRVPCPYRLYPALISALEIAIKRPLSIEIQRRITSKIVQHVQMGWNDQFRRDFETYGLYEAILYFHTYPFTIAAEDFIADACDLYCETASLYMTHHENIEKGDDSRIQAQLETLRFKGATHQHISRFEISPLKKPKSIETPLAPPADPEYQRKFPINRDMLLVIGESAIDVPGNAAGEVIEHLDARFTFSDFPGIQLVFFEVADLLQQFGIDPFGSTGQFVLQEIIEHMEEEFYGDYDRWVECPGCGEQFMPKVSLSTANMNLIRGSWACEKCQESAG